MELEKAVVVENNGEIVDKSAAGDAESIDYKALYEQASKSIADLTAERDSLANENKDLIAARDNAIAEGAKAREMNYTLSRQLNLNADKTRSAEEVMAEMFLGIKRGD